MMERKFGMTQEWVNGTLIWRDGPWILIDPRPTFGDYKEFDGWWREPTAEEIKALLDRKVCT